MEAERRAGGGTSGEADLTYALKLHSGIARRYLRVSILAYGTTAKSKAFVFWADDPRSKDIGPGYKWWLFGGTISSVHSDGSVHPTVIGYAPGWFDIGRVRITYQYAVWAPYP